MKYNNVSKVMKMLHYANNVNSHQSQSNIARLISIIFLNVSLVLINTIIAKDINKFTINKRR